MEDVFNDRVNEIEIFMKLCNITSCFEYLRKSAAGGNFIQEGAKKKKILQSSALVVLFSGR